MGFETINTHGAVALFHQFMQPNSDLRVLRLVGDPKMGKSHLLTKVFRTLARKDYQAREATLDLRNPTDRVPDILEIACRFIGIEECDGYNTAYQAWITQSRSQSHLEVKGIRAIFSLLHISVHGSLDEPYYRDRDLTRQFVNDISKLQDKLLLLMFDTVNAATEGMQQWLMDILLVQVSRLPHIRVIVAGRSLPDAHGSYAALCGNYQLKPVTEVDEYIAYCRNLDLTLSEQSIPDIARGCKYTPGLFAEFVSPTFLKQALVHE